MKKKGKKGVASLIKKLALGGAGAYLAVLPFAVFAILVIASITGGYLLISGVTLDEESQYAKEYGCSCGDCSQGIKLKDGTVIGGGGTSQDIAGGGMGNNNQATAGLSSKAFGDEQVPGATAYESKAMKEVYIQLRGYGYSEAATFGIIGNIWQESHFKPSAVNPDSGMYGLIQWDKSRKKACEAAVASYNEDNPGNEISFSEIHGQIWAVHWEMTEGGEKNSFKAFVDKDYKITHEKFMSLTDPQLACEYFCVAIERCTGGQDPSILNVDGLYQDLEARKQFAQTAADFFTSGTYEDGVVPGDYDSTHSNGGNTGSGSSGGSGSVGAQSTNGLKLSEKAFETTGRITSNVNQKGYLTEEKSNMARQLYIEFRKLGYSDQATFGILGNCWQESDFNMNEQTGSYSGLFQLDGEREAEAKRGVAGAKLDWNTMAGQAYGVHHDWTAGERGSYCWNDNGWLKPEYLITIDTFMNLTDTELACDYFCIVYEGCYERGAKDDRDLKPEISAKDYYQELKNRRELSKAMETYFMGGAQVEGGTTAIPSPGGQSGSGIEQQSGVVTDVKLTYGAENVDLPNWTPGTTLPREVAITECKPLVIKQHLINAKYNDFNASDKIDAFVVHYWAGNGVSGDNLYSWFKYGTDASSNFSIGTDGIVWQFNRVDKSAWANNNNYNKLSVEVANPKSNGQYASASYESLVHLTAYIAYTYNLSTDFAWSTNSRGNMYRDLGNIRRHYDNPNKYGNFRGKSCPLYWTPADGSGETGGTTPGGNSRWIAFKEDVTDYIIRFHDHPNFAPQGDGIAGIETAEQYKKDAGNANWSNGSVISGGAGIVGDGNLSGLYVGAVCGCEIPCKKCDCHDDDWKEIQENQNVNNQGNEQTGGSGGNVSDGVIGSGPTRAEKDPSFGDPGLYKIENGKFTWTSDRWQSSVFLAGARQVMIEMHAVPPPGDSRHQFYSMNKHITLKSGIYMRTDCTGFVSATLQYLGYLPISNSSSFNTAGEVAVLKSLGFQEVPVDEMQPGDIYWYRIGTAKDGKGHSGIFAGWTSEAKDTMWAYDFGGDGVFIQSGANYYEPCRKGRSTIHKAFRPVPLDRVNIAGRVYEYKGSDAMVNQHFVEPPELEPGTQNDPIVSDGGQQNEEQYTE